MISQGKDGLSRGDMYEVIMEGGNMLSFLSLEKLALARSPDLSKWIEVWDSTLGRSWRCYIQLDYLNVDTITMEER